MRPFYAKKIGGAQVAFGHSIQECRVDYCGYLSDSNPSSAIGSLEKYSRASRQMKVY
jgi:hypothetical protein